MHDRCAICYPQLPGLFLASERWRHQRFARAYQARCPGHRSRYRHALIPLRL